MKWSDNITVRSSDTDINGIASASAVLRYMQDAAFNQHYFCGPSLDELRASGKAYVLSRIAMRLLSPLYPNDKITVSTWGCPSKGTSLPRCAQIFRGEELIASLSSTWALIDIHNRGLYRAEDIGARFGTDEPIEIGVPLRVMIPKELELTHVGSKTVTYSDADENGHMNNTGYPGLLCDFLPSAASAAATDDAGDSGLGIHTDHRPALTGKRVTAMSISFVSEARIGETIDVLCGERDGVYYFRTRVPDGRCGIEARAEIGDIEA